ncbi:hypothetical protein JXA48_02210 [Candidatus Woesearchaeota archaeon]|nr:hypothetical protein [Candidatus Woesearchaeota archaeon]
MNNKGFTYLIAVSFLIATLIVVYLSATDYGFQDQQELYKNRIVAMDNFVSDFNQDVHRASYIASFRTLLSLEDYVAVNGEFFNNTEDQFKETFYYGQINRSEAELMNGSSFEDYLSRVNVVAEKIGIHSNVTVTDITLSQSDFWSIDVVITALVNITDNHNIASWSFEKNYSTNVPIYDLRDPLYSTFTFNRVPNTIRKLDVPYLVNGTDTFNLETHINGSYYLESTDAPSFLQRFENNLSPSPYGIESIVNVGLISAQEVGVCEDCIKVDYMYFNGLTDTKLCDVQNINPNTYFVIPLNQNETYEVSNLTFSTGGSCNT